MDSSFDAVGVLLCIRINTQHQLIMQRRRVAVLDNFLTSINLMLWPRFQTIIDMHVGSIKKHGTPAPDIHTHFVFHFSFALQLSFRLRVDTGRLRHLSWR